MAKSSRKDGRAQLEKDALDRAKQYYSSLPGPSSKAKNGTKPAVTASPNLKRSAVSVATADNPSSSKRKKQAATKKSPTSSEKKERLTKRQQAGLAHAQRWAAQQGIAVKGTEPVAGSASSAIFPKATAQKRQVSVEHNIKAEPEASRFVQSAAPIIAKRTTLTADSPRRDPPAHEESFLRASDKGQPDAVEEEEEEKDMHAVPPTQSYFVPICGIVLLILGAFILVQKEGSVEMASRWVNSLLDTTVISSKTLVGRGITLGEQLMAMPLPQWANNVMAESEALSQKLISLITTVLEDITSSTVEGVQTRSTMANSIDVDLPMKGTMSS